MRLFGDLSSKELLCTLIGGIAADSLLLLMCGTHDSRTAALPAAFVLIWIGLYDRRKLIIPPVSWMIIVAAGIVRILWEPNLLWLHLASAFASGLLMLLPGILLPKGSLGGGDVKLMTAAGLLLGPVCAFAAFLFAVCTALMYRIPAAAHRRKRVFAFGPYLTFGIWCGLLFGDRLWALL